MTELAGFIETLATRLDLDESLELELKSAAGGLPKDLWPTLSAFANTRGGWVLLGVRETAAGPVVGGVGNPSALVKQLFDGLHSQQKISHPVCGAEDVSVEQVDGGAVVVIRVPVAPRRIRPVFLHGNVYEGTYVRRHSGDYHCTRADVARMIREASDTPTDATILPHLDWEDIDGDTVRRYRRRHANRHPGHPWLAYDDARFLRAAGAWARDKERQVEGFTVAGLLMFGTDEAIRGWRPRHLIDFRLLPAEPTVGQRWEDRTTWEGNLLGAFEAVHPKLTRGLPNPFRLKNGVRAGEGPAEEAMREALVNLLVHADYTESDASLITRGSAEFSFRNPGASRVPALELLTSENSDPRNPALVRLFRFIGLAEEGGSGMPTIVGAWRQLGFALPDVHVDGERYEFALRLRYAHLIGDEDRAWLARLGGPWDEGEQMALVMARHCDALDNRDLQLRTGMHSADVSQLIRRLRGRGLFVPVGDGRYPPRYCLGPSATDTRALASSAPSLQPSTSGNLPSIGGSGTSLGGNEVSLGGNTELSSVTPVQTQPAAVPSGSDATAGELAHIAAPLRARARLDAPTRDDLFVALCRVTPLSLARLVELSGRNADHVREIVRGLLAAGRLAYEHPDRRRHPGQRYVAAQPDPAHPTITAPTPA